ncbi:MAG: hypothetical protein L0H93_01955 [Nocardioides sp.]|nr:hypothetical protein [Nocardioides sp.]
MTPQIIAQFAAQLVSQHMGQLHAYEQYLVFALAFGPFVVLGLVVFLVRRRDVADDAREADKSRADETRA